MFFIKKIIYFFIKIRYLIVCKKVKIGHGVRINPHSKMSGYNKISDNTYFKGEIGTGSYIGMNCVIVGKIGKFCSISHNVRFLYSAHPTHSFISTSPAFYSTAKQSGISFVSENKFDEHPLLDGEEYGIVIGNDVLISNGAILIGPLRIGNGAIIGAGAVVTKDVGPYEIVAGVPARVIGKRFSDCDIDFINDSCWWDKDFVWLKEHAEFFSSCDKFITFLKAEKKNENSGNASDAN